MARKSGGRNNMGRKKSSLPSKSVRVHEDVYDNAMILAAIEKKDLTLYLSDRLRDLLTSDLKTHGLKPNLPKREEP